MKLGFLNYFLLICMYNSYFFVKNVGCVDANTAAGMI